MKHLLHSFHTRNIVSVAWAIHPSIHHGQQTFSSLLWSDKIPVGTPDPDFIVEFHRKSFILLISSKRGRYRDFPGGSRRELANACSEYLIYSTIPQSMFPRSLFSYVYTGSSSSSSLVMRLEISTLVASSILRGPHVGKWSPPPVCIVKSLPIYTLSVLPKLFI